MPAAPGDRVVVPFGARERVGVVVEVGDGSAVASASLKPVTRVLDDAPALPADWLEQMRFLASYYQRPLGETRGRRAAAAAALAQALAEEEKGRGRRSHGPAHRATFPGHAPNAAQAAAIERIGAALGCFRPFLLHGITGSGKTEVYLRLIASGHRARAAGARAGARNRPHAAAGGALPAGVSPARASPCCTARSRTRARTHAWLDAARGDAQIVLGTRLAVLTPLPRLGLVVVDEEHDSSFKQQEGLRYSGRDAAILRAKLAGCPVVLGTATPSLETWHNCRAGRYELLALPERAVPGARLPVVRTVDLRTESADHGLAEVRGRGHPGAHGARRAKPGVHQPPRLCAGALLRGLRLGRRLHALQRAPGAACGRPAAALPPLRRRGGASRAPARPAATST